MKALKAKAGQEISLGLQLRGPLLQTRGETILVAGENVLFELGLFIGKIYHHKAFIVHLFVSFIGKGKFKSQIEVLLSKFIKIQERLQ